MVLAVSPVTFTVEPVPLNTQYQPAPACVPEPKAVFAVYTVPFTGDGVPLAPANTNTALWDPLPFVQLMVLVVGPTDENVTLVACVVGAFKGVVTFAGLVPFVVVK